MFVRPLLLVFVTLLTSAAYASPCADDQDSGCANSAVQLAKGELESRYQHLLEQLGQGSVRYKRLINAQRTWQTFRDAECEYLTTYGEQNGQHAQNYDRCVQDMTEQRTRALQHYQQCDNASDECTIDAN